MTSWREAREKLLAENPAMRAEYDRLGPRFEALSRLISERSKQKLSQTEVARRMHVQPNVVSRLESAQHSPRLDTLVDYAHALGFDVSLRLVKEASRNRSTRSAASKRGRARASHA